MSKDFHSNEGEALWPTRHTLRLTVQQWYYHWKSNYSPSRTVCTYISEKEKTLVQTNSYANRVPTPKHSGVTTATRHFLGRQLSVLLIGKGSWSFLMSHLWLGQWLHVSCEPHYCWRLLSWSRLELESSQLLCSSLGASLESPNRTALSYTQVPHFVYL